MAHKGILQRLKEGPVVGDGSYAVILEKRGYVRAGPWTPECVIEYPDGVRELHKEYIRAGSEVIQALTFYSTQGKLDFAESTKCYKSEELNEAACLIAREVVGDSNVLVLGGVSPTPTYLQGKGKQAVQAEFKVQCDVCKENKVDFLLGEFFDSVEEAEWAIEIMKSSGMPVACTLRIGPSGDVKDISPAECAIRMAKAGADIVGINCLFDPVTSLKTIRMMKEGLQGAGLSPYLMVQPAGNMCPDVENIKDGHLSLPEYPLAMEPRLLTRWEVRRFAREAYDLGVRYLGGCCGFEPYHIREIAEELAEERGFRPPGKDKHASYGGFMKDSMVSCSTKRSGKDYWMNLKPGSGRPNH